MTTPEKPHDSWTRYVLIGLLAFTSYTLLTYAPLVPKALVFMDDVHTIREKADGYQQLAAGIQKSLESLEKKLNFFKREAERKGMPWPDP